MHKVMVYGSLKKGFGNHGLLKSDTTNYLGTVIIEGFNMFSLGAFPAIREGDKGQLVQGELYEVDDKTLSHLDMLEGNGSFYQRIQVKSMLNDEVVWVYKLMDHHRYEDEDYKEGVATDGNLQIWTR